MNIKSKSSTFSKLQKENEEGSNQSTAPFTNVDIEIHSKSDLKWDLTQISNEDSWDLIELELFNRMMT